MGAATAKPLGPEETKAYKNFKKYYKQDHPGMEEAEVERRALNEWGKLMGEDKLFFSTRPRKTKQQDE
ncbi:uncharacterized protein [Drosophila bipectinata]|uniref:uncharacterized protein n=1 Tax=Drosophila bipectinata TaxID=42026 RepID=UPI0038B357BF